MRKPTFALLSALIVVSGFLFIQASHAQEEGTDTTADDLFGDGASPSSPPPVDGSVVEETPDEAPSTAALDQLETLKINRSELTAFMREGGLKSRVLK